jgi:CMP-2-keto-3-deoxyoctulosonic acid synthetase
MGVGIKVVLTDYESWGVDRPEDVVRVEQILREKRSR